MSAIAFNQPRSASYADTAAIELNSSKVMHTS
jgi:hypothetical protein